VRQDLPCFRDTFCRPEIIKYKRLSQNQLAIFRLQVEVGRNKPDFRIIESLIKTDLTLSYKIMRYMKHTAFKYAGACNFSKLTLSEVLMYLGENQLRRFVAVVVLASAGNDTVNELYPLSMMRGNSASWWQRKWTSRCWLKTRLFAACSRYSIPSLSCRCRS
jgi:c-di-GMP-related signal transduction protein